MKHNSNHADLHIDQSKGVVCQAGKVEQIVIHWGRVNTPSLPDEMATDERAFIPKAWINPFHLFEALPRRVILALYPFSMAS